MTSIVLGLDIGGANIKAATSDGRATSLVFPLWKKPGELAGALGNLRAQFPDVMTFAITMTGELCDCFRSKADGVRHIVEASKEVFGQDVGVYQLPGKFVLSESAILHWKQTAASNWHALAKFAGRYAPRGPGMLIDCGSTTTDIIALADGVTKTKGTTDVARLKTGELVYTGVKRTPLCALLPPGETCAEFFATTQDAYVTLGFVAEEPMNTDTADGQPLTKDNSEIRLARMLGGDAESVAREEIQHLARTVIHRQELIILSSVQRVVDELHRMHPEYVTERWNLICSGSGESLARDVFRRSALRPDRIVCFSEVLGPKLSECAPAYALAKLACEANISGSP